MRYLVATDGSEESDEAVRLAVGHANGIGADLEIVHVLTPETKLIDGDVVMAGEEAAIEEAERVLGQARDLAVETADEDADLDVDTDLLTGRPAAAIADHAVEISAGAIYVGHRGLSSEREQVVGSVAKSVVDRATVPVMVVR